MVTAQLLSTPFQFQDSRLAPVKFPQVQHRAAHVALSTPALRHLHIVENVFEVSCRLISRVVPVPNVDSRQARLYSGQVVLLTVVRRSTQPQPSNRRPPPSAQVLPRHARGCGVSAPTPPSPSSSHRHAPARPPAPHLLCQMIHQLAHTPIELPKGAGAPPARPGTRAPSPRPGRRRAAPPGAPSPASAG